jgi:hypothetical protein
VLLNAARLLSLSLAIFPAKGDSDENSEALDFALFACGALFMRIDIKREY